MDFTPLHVEHTGRIRIAAPLRDAFLFFTPDGERRWVPGWAPEYLHPRDGTHGPGLVFTTNADGEHTVWLVTRFDSERGAAEYVRVTPGSRIGIVTIACEVDGPGATVVKVSYRLTALSTAGNATLSAFDATAFAAMLRHWEQTVNHSL
jgi:hypothetical protein